MPSLPRQFAAPAKVNFGLRILGRRSDGYHDVQTILQMLDLCDWLTFGPNNTGTIRLTCCSPQLPTDEGNLVVRAAKLLQQAFQVQQGVDITLEKRIPIAAGLGGGSSDAATTLLALNHAWKLRHPYATLHPLAVRLGSDVPFFLGCPTALAHGRGEILSAVQSPPPLTGVLLNPGFGVSAGWAYAQFNGRSMATDGMVRRTLEALARQELACLAGVMVNDLEPGVVLTYPVIRELQEALSAVGAVITFMTGSGPTVVGIFPPRVDLLSAVTSLRQHSAWAVIPFTTLSESVHPELRC